MISVPLPRRRARPKPRPLRANTVRDPADRGAGVDAGIRGTTTAIADAKAGVGNDASDFGCVARERVPLPPRLPARRFWPLADCT